MTLEDHGGAEQTERGGAPPMREPALRAPWPPLLLAASFLALHALQRMSGAPDAVLSALGFVPADLAAGRWAGLVTSLFVHGNWPHAFLNALGTLAFGAPVARLFGRGAGATTAFFAFFLICGVLANLGFAAVHWGGHYVLVGASGAAGGLMGAASRLLERRNRLAPFLSRSVVSMGVAWVIVNVVIGFVGLGAVAGDAPIAWEAHLAGYAAGLLLVGPFARLLKRA
jgi:membrane associated rhomboid family serine protease